MTISEEIELLHRDCMSRLNAMHWACDDMAMSLELIAEQLKELDEMTDEQFEMSRHYIPVSGEVTSAPTLHHLPGGGRVATFVMDWPAASGTPDKGYHPFVITCWGQLASEVASPLGLALGDRVTLTGEMLATVDETTLVTASKIGFADDQQPAGDEFD